MRLLIAEDDVFLAMELEETVLRAGHEVVCNTGSAKEALDYAREMGATLALMDIGLSDGQEAGVWLARSLRELGIPSIFLSGQSTEARNAKDAALGYLPKPYTSAELAAALELASVIIRGREPNRPPFPRAWSCSPPASDLPATTSGPDRLVASGWNRLPCNWSPAVPYVRHPAREQRLRSR